MAKADQIKALIKSHAEGDDKRFFLIAEQIAAQAGRSGHGKLAQELRKLIDRAKGSAEGVDTGGGKRAGATTPTVRGLPAGAVPLGRELAGLLTVSYPETRVADMALDDGLRQQIDRVLLEQRQKDCLRGHGLAPLRKLLLVGPPGTGKTMTASALAGDLGLPLFTIKFDGLFSRFLGETAAKLRLIFDATQKRSGVYLFDEFDALGGQRSIPNDVGEVRRVLNSFLQFLEMDDSDSLVIGATNHVTLLDRALFRRFDAALKYSLPSKEIATKVMQARLSGTSLSGTSLREVDTADIDWAKVATAAGNLSHAELTHACEQAAKNAILKNTAKVQTGDLITALTARAAGIANPAVYWPFGKLEQELTPVHNGQKASETRGLQHSAPD